MFEEEEWLTRDLKHTICHTSVEDHGCELLAPILTLGSYSWPENVTLSEISIPSNPCRTARPIPSQGVVVSRDSEKSDAICVDEDFSRWPRSPLDPALLAASGSCDPPPPPTRPPTSSSAAQPSSATWPPPWPPPRPGGSRALRPPPSDSTSASAAPRPPHPPHPHHQGRRPTTRPLPPPRGLWPC